MPDLITDLDSPKFAVRIKAQEELQQLGAEAEPALRHALMQKPSPEARERLALLLEKCGTIAPELLQAVRGVEVLEYLRTAEARDLLGLKEIGLPSTQKRHWSA
jgi:hypothetical protein